MQRPNWCEYSINKDKSLLIRLASLTGNKISTNLLTSFYTKPSSVTLNYGEKRLFNFKQNENSEININIPKAVGSNIKYRIDLHAVKGNFVFNIMEQSYNLGLQANYKEDMSIIIDSDNVDKNLVLKANKLIFDKVNINNEFVFSVEYTVESNNKIIYEIENEKMNSFKFYKESGLSNIHLFMKANYTITNNKKTYKDINMNIKIYTENAEFDIKSYIVNEAIVEKCKNGSLNAPEGNTIGNIVKYINGGKKEYGDLALSKLEIGSDSFNNYINDNSQIYVYLIFTQKEGNQNKNVNINIYSYDMSNKKPLAMNELYIQKIPPNSIDYQFLLVKSDLFYSNDILIQYSPPNSIKYDYGVMLSKNANNERATTKEIISTSNMNNGKKELLVNSREANLRYLLFNIYADKNNLENNQDLFLFKYKHYDLGKELYFDDCNLDFNVTGTLDKLTFDFKTYNPRYETGKSVIIINGYDKNSVSTNATAFSLIFSDKKPAFTQYIIGKTKDKQEFSTNLSGGDYIFACLQVIEDSEREEFIGQKLVTINLGGKNGKGILDDFIDYVKNHVLATVIIALIIIGVITMMICICKKERNRENKIEIKVKEVSGELVDS